MHISMASCKTAVSPMLMHWRYHSLALLWNGEWQFDGLVQDFNNSGAIIQNSNDAVNWCVWVRSRRCGCLVTLFCYQMIAKPGNKTAAPLWSDPYIDGFVQDCSISLLMHWRYCSLALNIYIYIFMDRCKSVWAMRLNIAFVHRIHLLEICSIAGRYEWCYKMGYSGIIWIFTRGNTSVTCVQSQCHHILTW